VGVGATWSTWGARWFERAGVRTFGAASHSTDHWHSISLFSRGRDAHLPSSSPPRRARPTREWGRQTALRPEKALGYLIAKKKGTKKAGLGFANPKLVSGNIRKLRHGQTVRKSPKKLHPISTGGSGDSKTFTIFSCRSWRESPRRVWRLGARTSEERPEERREQQQVRDVSDDSRRPSLEPVARGGSPRGIPRGRRRRAPSPRSGRCGRTHHHRARLRAPRRRFDRRSHPASRGAPPTRRDAMLVVAVPFESHRFRVLPPRAPGSAVC